MKINTNQVVWGSVGAGAKGVVSGLLRRFVPNIAIPDDIATGVAGFAMANYGKGVLQDIGMGMLIASVGTLIQRQVGSLGMTTTTKTMTTSNGNALANYMLTQYGVVI